MNATTTTTPAPTPTPAPAQSTAPIGTPPGGGRWTWDAAAQAWVPITETPQE
jgi:hypothetical protein